MSRLIDLYLSDSLEVVEKLKSKLNLLKSPMNLLNQAEISELNVLQDKDIENFERLKKYFEAPAQTQSPDILESIFVYKELKEEIEKRKRLIKYYEDKFSFSNNLSIRKKKSEVNYQIETENSVISTIETTQEQDFPLIESPFLNSIISTRQVVELKGRNCLSSERQFLKEVFDLKEDEEKGLILVDFYEGMYRFSVEKGMSVEETSTLMSVMYFVFNYSILGRKIIKKKSMELFMRIIEYHSNGFPPYSYYIFSKTRKEEIVSYVNSSFYRNYSLYENIFKYNVNIFLSTKEAKVIPNEDFPFPSFSSLRFEFLGREWKVPVRNEEEVQKSEKSEKSEKSSKKEEFEEYVKLTNKKINDFNGKISQVNKKVDNDLKVVEEEGKEREVKERVEEVKELLEVKVSEVCNEVNERMLIGSKLIEKRINMRLEKK